MKEVDLEKIARKFRSGFEVLSNTEKYSQHIGIRNFPKGSCFISASTLGAGIFQSEKIHPVLISNASRILDGEWRSHAWLLVDGWHVDITGDQFKDNDQKIRVSKKDDWFNTFDYDVLDHYNKSYWAQSVFERKDLLDDIDHVT